MSVNRRDFLRSVASISGATISSGAAFGQTEQMQSLDAALPTPESSGIEHVVAGMMENRSFDHEWRWQLAPLTARDASNEIANLVHALDLNQPDISVPDLPVIADPPREPYFNDFSFAVGQQPGPATSEHAMALAQRMHSRGVDNETYDFYLLMKSERTNGWRIPGNLRAK